MLIVDYNLIIIMSSLAASGNSSFRLGFYLQTKYNIKFALAIILRIAEIINIKFLII